MLLKSSLLNNRILKYVNSLGILPVFQFGFRPSRSTVGASALLYEVVHNRLTSRKRTYACFVDFSKAFDSVDRTLLLVKLQTIGIPRSICLLFHHILKNLKSVVRSGSLLSKPFKASKGVPQGDPSSPLLFNLFLSDLPDSLAHQPPLLNNVPVPYIQYADDLVLLAESAEELQIAIDSLALYCSENSLNINIGKTKCLIFRRGRLPNCSFSLDGKSLEIVSEFKYLGFIFSPQLSFTKHLKNSINKADSRCGYLFGKLQLKNLPLPLVLQVFDCYILPLFLYGLPLWINNCNKSSLSALDAVFTKFLKRYLGVPKFVNNSLVHFLCNTRPLSHRLYNAGPDLLKSISWPNTLSGHQLSFAYIPESTLHNPIPSIPSHFWNSRIFHQLPSNPNLRKSLCFDLLDLNHYSRCSSKYFHLIPHHSCFCIHCKEPLFPYHAFHCPVSPQDRNSIPKFSHLPFFDK